MCLQNIMGGVDNLISKLRDGYVVAQTRTYTVILPPNWPIYIWGPENQLFWIMQPVVSIYLYVENVSTHDSKSRRVIKDIITTYYHNYATTKQSHLFRCNVQLTTLIVHYMLRLINYWRPLQLQINSWQKVAIVLDRLACLVRPSTMTI